MCDTDCFTQTFYLIRKIGWISLVSHSQSFAIFCSFSLLSGFIYSLRAGYCYPSTFSKPQDERIEKSTWRVNYSLWRMLDYDSSSEIPLMSYTKTHSSQSPSGWGVFLILALLLFSEKPSKMANPIPEDLLRYLGLHLSVDILV